MKVDQLDKDDLVQAAAGLQSAALNRLLRVQYSQVCRIAHALSTRPVVAKKIVKRVMKASAQFLPKWQSAQESDNWFLHHTILVTREMVGSASPKPENDYLIQHAGSPTPPYLAFVRALRLLPPQQREAFLLSRGERLEIRPLALAMDCSITAAKNHLSAAEEALQKIAGNGFEPQIVALAGVYASLTPPEDKIAADVAIATSSIRRRYWRRMLITFLEMLVLALLAWTIWRLSRMIVV
jgi:DNA-directed RNA polymerase specialized sigma24 family protein